MADAFDIIQRATIAAKSPGHARLVRILQALENNDSLSAEDNELLARGIRELLFSESPNMKRALEVNRPTKRHKVASKQMRIAGTYWREIYDLTWGISPTQKQKTKAMAILERHHDGADVRRALRRFGTLARITELHGWVHRHPLFPVLLKQHPDMQITPELIEILHEKKDI